MLYTPQKFINYGQLSSEDRENRGINKFFAIQLQCTYKMAPHHILKRKKKHAYPNMIQNYVHHI